jgi:hypothetical protein
VRLLQELFEIEAPTYRRLKRPRYATHGRGGGVQSDEHVQDPTALRGIGVRPERIRLANQEGINGRGIDPIDSVDKLVVDAADGRDYELEV